jgi:hypothetical protein
MHTRRLSRNTWAVDADPERTNVPPEAVTIEQRFRATAEAHPGLAQMVRR